eukprot:gene10405-13975_t
MYLYRATSDDFKAQAGGSKKDYIARTIRTELLTSILARNELRDTTSSKLNVKGPKQAATLHKATLGVLRKQLQAFPYELKEESRMNYLLEQNIKRKDFQEFQCLMMGKLEKILRRQIIESGSDYQKYKIGGYDGGTYERFFRIEPGLSITKAQLTTALRRSFGDTILQHQGPVNRLFDSFDFRGTDEMEWRSFLYLLVIMMQPSLPTNDHLRLAYAIFSSVGSLDMDCTDKLSVGKVKELICVPVLQSMRSEIKAVFDQSWTDLSGTDTEAIAMASRGAAVSNGDPDLMPISYKMFRKILTETAFSDYMKVATAFGRKDTRMWTCKLEEYCYHPVILKKIRILRRESRNNREADEFISKVGFRMKSASISMWKKYVNRRNLLRYTLIAFEIRIQIGRFGLCFDKWRRVIIEEHSANLIQRYGRGLIARQRKYFIIRLKNRAIMMQAATRQMFFRNRYNKLRIKVFWAATQIQRVYRGKMARNRVQTMVEALYDTGKRQLVKDREAWMQRRYNKASLAIQMGMRRFMRRRATMRKLQLAMKMEQIELEQKATVEKARIEKEVYMTKLTNWYEKRKSEYDLTVMTESRTVEQKKLIMDRRLKIEREEKAIKAKIRLEQLEKIKEETIETWIKAWEVKIEERGHARRKECKSCLILPDTPEQLLLQKDLKKRIKKQIKEVLRRADKQKIPMEIPEATDIAKNDVIEEEVGFEKERAKIDMKNEAERIQREDEIKAEKLKEQQERERKSRQKWALLTLQCYGRAVIARKMLRKEAYKRYKKLFDPETHNYYYLDKKSNKSYWDKPKSFGNYDIEMDDSWIEMKDAINNIYYYNPGTWKMSWTVPMGTKLCEVCETRFAVARLNYDNVCYCNEDLYAVCHAMMNEGWGEKDILFKLFEGNNQDAKFVRFESIRDTSLFTYTRAIDHSLVMTEEEERSLQLSMTTQNYKSSGKHKKKKDKEKKKKKKKIKKDKSGFSENGDGGNGKRVSSPTNLPDINQSRIITSRG